MFKTLQKMSCTLSLWYLKINKGSNFEVNCDSYWFQICTDQCPWTIKTLSAVRYQFVNVLQWPLICLLFWRHKFRSELRYFWSNEGPNFAVNSDIFCHEKGKLSQETVLIKDRNFAVNSVISVLKMSQPKERCQYIWTIIMKRSKCHGMIYLPLHLGLHRGVYIFYNFFFEWAISKKYKYS